MLLEGLSARFLEHKMILFTLTKKPKSALANRDAPYATFPVVSASETLFIRIDPAGVSFSGEYFIV